MPEAELIKKTADYAAMQSDRWLFIALLIIGMLGMWMLAKYFTRQHELLASRLDETNVYVRTTLATMVAESKVVIQMNTDAIRKCESAIINRKNDPAFNLTGGKGA